MVSHVSRDVMIRNGLVTEPCMARAPRLSLRDLIPSARQRDHTAESDHGEGSDIF